MAAIRKTDADRSVYDNLDDIVRDLAALRDQADEKAARLADETRSEPQPDPSEQALPRATLRPLRVAGRDGSEPAPFPVVPAEDTFAALCAPEPPLQQTHSRPSTRPDPTPKPLPRFLRSLPVEVEEEEHDRRISTLATVTGICTACAVALLGFGAYSFLGGGQPDRLPEAYTSVRVEPAAAATGSKLLQSAQRRPATTAEPDRPSAVIPAAAAAPREVAVGEQAAAQRVEDERPRASGIVLAPASGAPAADIEALANDEETRTAPVGAATTISAHVTPAAAPADSPAPSPLSPAGPVASAQPQPAAAAPPAQAETQIAALPPPSAPLAQRPRFSAEETGRLIARARSMIDTTSDIAAARLLLQRAADMGDPAAAFALAETFDPNVLSRMRVFGLRANADQARRLYQQALDAGVENARPRLAALGN